MSEVKVNKISPRSGTAITLGDSGDTFTIPSGATLAIAGSVTGFTSAGIDDNATSVAITIDSNENVGIGTTSPATTLHVSGGTANTVSLIESTDAYAWLSVKDNSSANSYINSIGASGDNLQIISKDITFRTASAPNVSTGTYGTERMRILSDGKVGIGTSSPSEELEVSGGQNTIIKSKTTTSTALGGFEAHGSGSSYIKLFQHGPSFGGTTFGGVSGNDQSLIEAQAASSVVFSTQGNAGGSNPDFIFAPQRSQKVIIKSDGNVGIGTSSPDDKFHVMRSDSGGTAVGGSVITAENNGNCFVSLLGLNSDSCTLFFGDNNNNNAGQLEYDHANDSMSFYTNQSERMRILSDGKVGIGTNSPGFDLVVKDASGAATIRAENGADNKIVDLIADSTGGLIRTIGSYPLVLNTNQTERMRILSDGKVGIGTSSPTAKLNVDGAIVGGQKGDSSPNNTDVSGVNSLTVSTGAGAQTINGLVGGVTGQVLHIIKTNSAFTLTIADQNATSPGVEIKTADGNNISLTNFGGVTLLFYNGAWWEVGK